LFRASFCQLADHESQKQRRFKMARMMNNQEKGAMTVQEAGRKGGTRTSQTHGREFYQSIGHKGGQKVRDLINRGKQMER
jgi:general stress protein YciG